MRSLLLSTALAIMALVSSGCATITKDQGCGVDAVSASGQCCQGPRVGGLLGRLRGEKGCVDCGNAACGNAACSNGNCGAVAGGTGRLGLGTLGMRGRIGSGVGCGPEGCGLGGRGILAGGFGRASGACKTCGMIGGRCGCGLNNHAPYTPAFQGPFGPDTGHYRYPYYTTRAPRDFLMDNPPSIGR